MNLSHAKSNALLRNPRFYCRKSGKTHASLQIAVTIKSLLIQLFQIL